MPGLHRRAVLPAYALVLALAILAPLLAPGYLLIRDAVSTPRSYLSDAALGLSEAAPRALPQDFAVAVVSSVVDGGVVVKVLSVVGLWLAGWGAARLVALIVPAAELPGGFVAATVAIWNPYVAERLLQGHWSLLVGYGCLPWIAVAVTRLRTDEGAQGLRSGWWPLLGFMALAGLTPTGLMLGAVVALSAVAVPGAGRSRLTCSAVTLTVAVLCAAPWLVASAAAGSLSSSQATGVTAFAARAEPGLGTVGSLAGLAGIWNAQAVPNSRTTLFAVVATAVLLVVVAVGLPTVVRIPAARPFLVLSVVAVVLPALAATGPGLAAVEAVVRAVPGLGVLRDGQKWVALAMPGYAVAAGAAAVTVHARVAAARPAAVAAVCCAAVIAVLPDLAWGVGGKVAAVRYPAGWAEVAARINADSRPVAVLPPNVMREFDWVPVAPVLDPLPRWVSADVLATGDLVIGGRTVPGEGARARDVQELLLAGAGTEELARHGVGWVVVEGPAAPLGLPEAYRDDDVALYRVGGDAPRSEHRGLLIGAHLVWLAALAAGVVGSAFARRRSTSTD